MAARDDARLDAGDVLVGELEERALPVQLEHLDARAPIAERRRDPADLRRLAGAFGTLQNDQHARAQLKLRKA